MYFSDTLSVASHVNFVLKNCAQRVYLIKQLRAQGLPVGNLTIIFNSLIISQILYAAPALVYCLHMINSGLPHFLGKYLSK